MQFVKRFKGCKRWFLGSLMVLLFFGSGKSQTAGKCGLPDNINSLPDFVQEEIRTDYKSGNECEKELLVTEDILNVLEMFDKDTLKSTSKPVLDLQPPPQTAPLIKTPEPNLLSKEENRTPIIFGNGPPSTEYAELTDSIFESTITTKLPNVNQKNETTSTSASTTPSITTTEPKTVQSTEQVSIILTSPTPETQKNQENPNVSVEEWKASEERRPDPSVDYRLRPATVSISKPSTPQYQRFTKVQKNRDYDYTNTDEDRINTKSTTSSGFRRFTKNEDYRENSLDSENQKPQHDHTFYRQNTHVDSGRDENTQNLPFLRGADDELVQLFQQVFDDPDIPSERRRQEEIHLLAVSYLNAKQLRAFNAWSTQRRKRIKAREQQLHELSRPAREALKRLALAGGLTEQRTQALNLPQEIKHELRTFAQKRLNVQK